MKSDRRKINRLVQGIELQKKADFFIPSRDLRYPALGWGIRANLMSRYEPKNVSHNFRK